MKLFATILKAPILAYRYVISPWLGPNCRFHPSCSSYALEALDKHGAAKGLALATRRVCRCHPLCKHHGLDPVPEVFEWREIIGYKRPAKKNNQESTPL